MLGLIIVEAENKPEDSILFRVKWELKIRGISPREFWEQWRLADEVVYVVRFKKLEASGIFYN